MKVRHSSTFPQTYDARLLPALVATLEELLELRQTAVIIISVIVRNGKTLEDLLGRCGTLSPLCFLGLLTPAFRGEKTSSRSHRISKNAFEHHLGSLLLRCRTNTYPTHYKMIAYLNRTLESSRAVLRDRTLYILPTGEGSPRRNIAQTRH